MSSPKVLILNQPLNNDTGGGITLCNLFRGWDKDKLAVAATGLAMRNRLDLSICDNYYRLGEKEEKSSFPFNLLKRKYPSGPVAFRQQKAATQPKAAPPSKARVLLIEKILFPTLEHLGLIHVFARLTLSEEFRKWLDDYNPDLIYAQATSLRGLVFTQAVKEYLKKPLIYHVMDDWPTVISQKGMFATYWRRRIDTEFRRLLDKSDVLMSIGDYMTQEYKRRYGKTFLPFHNPIQIDFWKKDQRTNYDLGHTFTLLYAGRTGLGIQESLKTISRAVEQVNQEVDVSVEFVLRTPEQLDWVNEFPSVRHGAFVPHSELPAIFAGAELMVLPYDFSGQGLDFIKFSMPTKASEYMASGTPTLVFAPRDTAVAEYATTARWAAVVTQNEVEVLAREIKKLVVDQAYRAQLAETAKELAEKKHSMRVVSKAFQNIIRETAGEAFSEQPALKEVNP